MYGRDIVGYCHLCLTSRCRHPASGQDLMPLQMLHVFAHSRDPHPAIKLWCQVPFTKSKTTFLNWNVLFAVSLKSKYIKSRTFNDKNRLIIKKVMVLKSCFLILPPGALTPQGTEDARKRDASKHWCTLQWCASRGWFIAHENWTSWQFLYNLCYIYMLMLYWHLCTSLACNVVNMSKTSCITVTNCICIKLTNCILISTRKMKLFNLHLIVLQSWFLWWDDFF